MMHGTYSVKFIQLSTFIFAVQCDAVLSDKRGQQVSVITPDANVSKYFSKFCIETPYIRCADKGICVSLKVAFITTHRTVFLILLPKLHEGLSNVTLLWVFPQLFCI